MFLFWRYLLKEYLSIFFLAFFSFIIILLTTRLEEIVSFAAFGASNKTLALFILYQVPYIIPIAMPLASLIAGFLVLSRLSNGELSAFRSGGISIKKILTPIMAVTILISGFNFTITSEFSTHFHLEGRKMAYQLMSSNPLGLLENTKLPYLKGAYFQLDPHNKGLAANDVVIVFKNQGTKRLNLFLAKSIENKNASLNLQDVSFITTTASDNTEDFDNLVIENQKKATTSLLNFTSLFKKEGWKIANDHLKFAFLKIKMKNLHKQLVHADASQKREIQKAFNKCRSDMVRRVSLGIAPITFTLLGATFGINITRNPQKRGVILIFCLGSLSLISFFIAKELGHKIIISSTLFLLPHLINLFISIKKLHALERGVE